MFSTQRIIYCLNPNCNYSINPWGEICCTSCQTPLVYRYLWASSHLANLQNSTPTKIPVGAKVADRYEVITPQVWLDTQPGLLPEIPAELPPAVIPYLKLYQERLHLPQAYGFVPAWEEAADNILLLANVPINETGDIYPTITDAWEQSSAVRQVYWLWQILQLWKPLAELGVANSLLVSDNLRVQGWCVRLLELHQSSKSVNLSDLAQSWQSWMTSTNTTVVPALEKIIQQMCEPEIQFENINRQLNTLLLSLAAELPLTLTVAGLTAVGSAMTHNEDTCYPDHAQDFEDTLQPYLSIVCDGIGGHEGGEVASQLAVQSVKLQIRALLREIFEQNELIAPDLLTQQIEASLRVVNNVICSRNDEQKRQGRERMATTLVMAVQVPQRVTTTAGWESDNTHELYLVNVGDSPAYWITRNYCQLLTVDDVVATREVRLARSLYQPALQRIDASALTQALGTKEADAINFVIQRFILEEDGILLLCSDGLSDHNLVEQFWQSYAVPLLTGQISIKDAALNWINLANEKNGSDNISVVLTLCRVSPECSVEITPVLESVEMIETEVSETEDSEIQSLAAEVIEPEVSIIEIPEANSLVLPLEFPEATNPVPISQLNWGKSFIILWGILILLMGGTMLGLLAWWQFHPQSFQQMCRQLPPKVQPACSRPH